MDIQALVLELRGRGIRLTPAGKTLNINAPRGALTPELRELIAANKIEIIANRQRFQYIVARISRAKLHLANTFPDRYDWGSDTDETRHAAEWLEAACVEYISGTGALGEIEGLFRIWIKTLERPLPDDGETIEVV